MLRVELLLLGHHHEWVHRRRRSEIAAVTDRRLHKRSRPWHHHRHGHTLSEQIVLAWVHVVGLELRREALEVSTDHWRLLQGMLADLWRPLLHHVLVHREDHRITDRRDRALVSKANERRRKARRHAQS